MARNDPYGAFNFLVEIDGVVQAGFAECSGLSSETDVIEYREGTEPTRFRKLPGLTKYANLVLKRGLTKNRDLWNWRKRIVDGQLDRRAVSVIVLDEARVPVVRFYLSEAWPCKWTGPNLSAKASEVSIETLELTFEGLEVE
ncbi:MAG: phage tail protein [Gemmatimonadales bacterium]